LCETVILVMLKMSISAYGHYRRTCREGEDTNFILNAFKYKQEYFHQDTRHKSIKSSLNY
jgi:hypothetical protein